MDHHVGAVDEGPYHAGVPDVPDDESSFGCQRGRSVRCGAVDLRRQ
jgi:hypothetical protein